MNVLSLFDGMSCGQIALERAGIKVDRYFACDIDKWAIKIADNHPLMHQLGDVSHKLPRLVWSDSTWWANED